VIDTRHCWLLAFLAACTVARSPEPVLQPAADPASFQVSTREALIVFPPEPDDFPWPVDSLADRFVGPLWNVTAAVPSSTPLAAAVQFRTVDSLQLPSIRSLGDLAPELGAFDCRIDSHIITCGYPLRATVAVDAGRVVLRITDATWLERLNRLHPDSAWIRVDRPNRRMIVHERLPIRYVVAPGGA